MSSILSQKIAKLITQKKRRKIETEVEKEIKEAFEYAEKSPFPKARDLYTDVFKGN